MAIASTDLILYGAASRPNDDTSLVGGAIDTADRPVFTQFAAAAKPEIVSDGVDTRNCTIVGRSAAGAILSETKALNGTTAVLFTNSFERVLTVTLASSDASRTVTVKEGAAGAVRATLNPSQTSVSALFRRSSSESAQVIRYEKTFFKNTHGTLSLQAAKLKLTADPAAVIEIGAAPSQDDTATATNRKTAPASVTFVDDNVEQNVPGTDLAAGAAIGVWIKQTLSADHAPINSNFTLQLAGQSA